MGIPQGVTPEGCQDMEDIPRGQAHSKHSISIWGRNEMLGSPWGSPAPFLAFHFVEAIFPCRVGGREGVGLLERLWPSLLSTLFHRVTSEIRMLGCVCTPEGENGFCLRGCGSIASSFSVPQLPDYLLSTLRLGT